MSEWAVVVVIVTLVGLVASVARPLIKLNTTITTLTSAVNHLQDNLGTLTTKNSESHGRIYKTLENHDERLDDHETRLTVIEKTWGA